MLSCEFVIPRREWIMHCFFNYSFKPHPHSFARQATEFPSSVFQFPSSVFQMLGLQKLELATWRVSWKRRAEQESSWSASQNWVKHTQWAEQSPRSAPLIVAPWRPCSLWSRPSCWSSFHTSSGSLITMRIVVLNHDLQAKWNILCNECTRGIKLRVRITFIFQHLQVQYLIHVYCSLHMKCAVSFIYKKDKTKKKENPQTDSAHCNRSWKQIICIVRRRGLVTLVYV